MRVAACGLLVLVVANVGTMFAEFAGVAAALEPAGVTRYASVPAAALAVCALVLGGGFHRVEHVLLALSAVFAAYVVSGLLAHPDWGAAAHGLLVPTLPGTRDALLTATATLGTTLAPWGLAFIQSYAVDKRLTPADLRLERVDVVTGAVMTGVIGFFVVVACAATLHAQGRSIEDAGDAATALAPLAGGLASTLFAVGLLGAGLLAAAVLPLSTAYSVSEALGYEAGLDDSFAQARLFYVTFGVVMAVSGAFVLVPGAPLVPILFLTQALNAVLLLPLLVLARGIASDTALMGADALGRAGRMASLAVIALIAVCLGALVVLAVG